MLEGLFVRKADFNKIKKILDKENFIYSNSDVENLLKGNQKGVRYGNVVLARREGSNEVRRFFKVILDGKLRTYKLFRRQVLVANALAHDEKYKFPKLEVKSFSFNPPVPYAVFETREEGEGFGFMHDKPDYYERITEEDANNIARVIYGFHHSGFDLDKKVFKDTQKISSDRNYFLKDLMKYLDKKITHKTKDGRESEETVEKLLENYTGIKDVKSEVKEVFDKNWKFVEQSKVKDKKYLVHADMALDNMYRHPDGRFEPLDFEWVGYTDNPVVPIMYDHGNMRARAWSSTKLQEILDRAMLKEGVRLYGDESLVRAALDLGILRSSLMMARFHMDYINTVKKDRRGEDEYFQMFPKTNATLKSVLTS